MQIQAIHLGQTIDIRKFQGKYRLEVLSREPNVYRVGKDEYLVIFRYGVIVLWNVAEKNKMQLLDRLRPFIEGELQDYPMETMKITKLKGGKFIVEDKIKLEAIDQMSINLVSVVLARSVVLEFFEKQVDEILADFGKLIDSFSTSGRTKMTSVQMLKQLGGAMKIQNQAVSQMAMLDKPDFTWNDVEMDELYSELEDEYEISDRYAVLKEKLDTLFQDSDFFVTYLDGRRSTNLELVIILLILVEVFLFTYELFWVTH
jgi:uncharacterized Rmd1/YagE family protein